jgi:hypothetical protein
MFNKDRRESRPDEPRQSRSGLNLGGNGQTPSNNRFASGATNVEFARENCLSSDPRRNNSNQQSRNAYSESNSQDESNRARRNLNSRVEFANDNINNDPNPELGYGSRSNNQPNKSRLNQRESNNNDSYYDVT